MGNLLRVWDCYKSCRFVLRLWAVVRYVGLTQAIPDPDSLRPPTLFQWASFQKLPWAGFLLQRLFKQTILVGFAYFSRCLIEMVASHLHLYMLGPESDPRVDNVNNLSNNDYRSDGHLWTCSMSWRHLIGGKNIANEEFRAAETWNLFVQGAFLYTSFSSFGTLLKMLYK